MTSSDRHAVRIAVGLGLSWVGQYLHNLLELDLSVWRPENSGPAIVAVGLALWSWRRPGRTSRALVAAWAVLLLLGGALLTVLPTGLLPFDPEQTAGHYATHALYGVLQLPLLWVALRGRPRGGARHERTPQGHRSPPG